MTRTRYRILNSAFPHLITATVVGWLPAFSNSRVVKIILDSFSFMQDENRMQIYAYVIMENHLHYIAVSDNLAREAGAFKSYTARKIIDFYTKINSPMLTRMLRFKKIYKDDRDNQFWQEGGKPKLIQNRVMMRQKIEYIHYNPVQRGYVEKGEDWRYSSAGNYTGKGGLIQVCTRW